MAYIASTAFEPRITNNEFNDLCNIAGKFYSTSAASDPSDCSAGLLCTKEALLPAEGFSSVYNENTWKMIPAASAATVGTPIYACNTYDTQLVTSADGNNWFVGTRTLGLGVPADRYGTFTVIDFDGKSHYRFGVGNISGTLSTNPVLTIEDGMLIPAAAAPSEAGAPYFSVMGTGNFTEGPRAAFGYVDVIACHVAG